MNVPAEFIPVGQGVAGDFSMGATSLQFAGVSDLLINGIREDRSY